MLMKMKPAVSLQVLTIGFEGEVKHRRRTTVPRVIARLQNFLTGQSDADTIIEPS